MRKKDLRSHSLPDLSPPSFLKVGRLPRPVVRTLPAARYMMRSPIYKQVVAVLMARAVRLVRKPHLSFSFNFSDASLKVNFTLADPTTAGGGCTADIWLTPPYTFSVTSGFGFYNGCDGMGADCELSFPWKNRRPLSSPILSGTSASCVSAIHDPSETFPVVTCEDNNVSQTGPLAVVSTLII